jgi:UDPglucose 6-dehydrogenase
MRVLIFGIGYVGLSSAVLLSERNDVFMVDIISSKVESINNRISPLPEDEFSNAINKCCNLNALNYDQVDVSLFDIVLIATPTDYSIKTNALDTKSIEDILELIENSGNKPLIVLKSTIPLGFTSKMATKHPNLQIVYIPEFLREGNSLFDSQNPTRVVVGLSDVDNRPSRVELFVKEMDYYIKSKYLLQYVSSTEAEAIKLFSNAFLAMRVAFFNELDELSEQYNLDSKAVINGVCADYRIGDYYNNPSFGYGGYCLPKDTKQLSNYFVDIPGTLIRSIDVSNLQRKKYIVEQIINMLSSANKTIGVYRLSSKHNASNYRNSCIIDIINLLQLNGVSVVIFDSNINESSFNYCKVCNDFDKFISISDLIIANRIDDKIKPFIEKIYTRDIFHCN